MNDKIKLIGFCCMAAFSAVAQHKNIEIGTLAKESKQSIPTVVINHKDAKIITVKGAGNTFYLSNDAGTSWQSMTADVFEQSEWMSVLSDAKGVLYAVCALPRDNHYRVVSAQSKDNGKTWSAPVAISSSGTDQRYPTATFDAKETLHVTWAETITSSDGNCESVVMMSTSSSGTKWSKPFRISQLAGGCEDGNKLITGGVSAIGPDGKMFVAWSNADRIYMDRSFGSNLWLENDISVNAIKPGWKQNVPGYQFIASQPQLMVDQSKGHYRGCIYLTWADQTSGEGDTDVWFLRSNNHGDNWSSPTKLGSTNAQTEQYGPRMAIDQVSGFVYVLFYDRGEHEDGLTDVVLAYSSESGGSFKTVTISETPFMADDKAGAGVYLDLVAYGGVIVPVWTRTADGKTSLWTTTIRQDELVKPVEQPKAKKKK